MANRSRQNPPASTPRSPARASRVIASTELLRGAREVVIEHRGQQYRLSCTSSGKLLLTK